MPGPAHRTLAHVLVHHVATGGDRLAYEYLHEDGRVDTLNYRELLSRSRGVAHRLRAADRQGGPALLVYPPGLDFVVAVWGCLLAGVPAVPTYPPLFGAADRVTQRFARLLADSRATALLADPTLLGVLTAGGDPAGLPTLVVPDQDGPDEPLPEPEDVALVQYTSGSTNQPKGVVLEHGNLIANATAISEVFRLDTTARVISWLPPYHDMGLIGNILTPVFGGFPVRLMSPVHFMKKPLDWLRQISELGVTHTGGPNFAYDLCVRRARHSDLSDLDLSSWRLAFNGAEPVRERTLTAFADRFADNGFRSSAFLPCYGLAEATLIMTGRHWAPDAVDDDGRVDCGPVISGHELVISDEGEIWVAGPSVTRGYWNDTGLAEDELFGVVDGRRFLRTGDLGHLRDGHLFVTGRCKDVLIQHGVNHHAHDLESVAVTDIPALRPTAAAFQTGDDAIVLAVELAGGRSAAPGLAADVRERVLAGTGAKVDVVVLCPPGTIPRTTSGKVQRNLTRTRYLAGELAGRVVGRADEPLERFLAEVFAAVCDVGECSATQSLASIGGDSIRGAEIAAVSEDLLTLPVPLDLVLDAQSPRELTGRLLARWTANGIAESQVVTRLAERVMSDG